MFPLPSLPRYNGAVFFSSAWLAFMVGASRVASLCIVTRGRCVAGRTQRVTSPPAPRDARAVNPAAVRSAQAHQFYGRMRAHNVAPRCLTLGAVRTGGRAVCLCVCVCVCVCVYVCDGDRPVCVRSLRKGAWSIQVNFYFFLAKPKHEKALI